MTHEQMMINLQTALDENGVSYTASNTTVFLTYADSWDMFSNIYVAVCMATFEFRYAFRGRHYKTAQDLIDDISPKHKLKAATVKHLATIRRNTNGGSTYMLCYEIANKIDARTFFPDMPQNAYCDKLESVYNDLNKRTCQMINWAMIHKRPLNVELLKAIRYFENRVAKKLSWELRRSERIERAA